MIYVNHQIFLSFFYLLMIPLFTFLTKPIPILKISLIESSPKSLVWLAANKLSLNVKKSNFLHFHHGKYKKPTLNLTLNGAAVEEKLVAKYLGVLIDNKLSWKSHIEHVKTKISKGNGMISKIRYYVNDSCLLLIFSTPLSTLMLIIT